MLRRYTFPLAIVVAALGLAGCGRGGPEGPHARAEAELAFLDHPLMPLHASAPER